MQPGHKESRPNSVLAKAQPTDLPLRNSRQSLRGQFNSWIETLRHAKPERSGHGSTSNRSARAGNRGEAARGVDDLSELCETPSFDLRKN